MVIHAVTVPRKALYVFDLSNGASGTAVGQGRLACYRATRSYIAFAHGISSVEEREFQFPSEQKWFMFSGKRLAFIDETVETSTNYGQDDFGFDAGLNESSSLVPALSNQEQNESPDLAPSPLAQNQAPGTPTDPGARHGTDETGTFLPSPSLRRHHYLLSSNLERNSSSPEDVSVAWHRPSITELRSKGGYRADTGYHGSSLTHGIYHPSLSCLGICEPLQSQAHTFPLRDFREAESIQYYTIELAPNFDLYDREKSFARGIVEAIGERPVLMGIISNLAATHREGFRRNRLSHVKVDRPWCIECIQEVMTVGNNMLDGCVLASIVLLRFPALIECKFPLSSLFYSFILNLPLAIPIRWTFHKD